VLPIYNGRRKLNAKAVSARSKSYAVSHAHGRLLQLAESSPVSIQTQSLALRALRLDGNRAKRKRLIALASSQSWLPLLRPSILLAAGGSQ